MKKILPTCFFFFLVFTKILNAAETRFFPAAVGWGNLIVPGLGATLRGEPGRGLIESATELTLFYGGTFGAKEGSFSIDTTIVVPDDGNLARPLLGTILQQAGLKLHMYNTFYNYQQAVISHEKTLEENEIEPEALNSQPLYRGDYLDVISAPFQGKYLGDPYVYSVLAAATAGIIYQYASSPVSRLSYPVPGYADALYGLSNAIAEPIGSAFGEEPLFRGFIQREFQGYTGSKVASWLMQSVLFASIHPSSNRVLPFFSAIYFGWLTNHRSGDIGPAIAIHFWVNFLNGIADYLTFHRAQGKNFPLAPPLAIKLGFNF